MTANPERYCMCPDPPVHGGRAQTRAALLNAFRWGVSPVLKVKFLGGDPALQQRVKAVALEWTGPKMANVRLELVPAGDADIRIAFGAGNGSWSYVGTQSKTIRQQDPTMNFGWLAPASQDDELRRVVLHEFGHALGLIHEHQSPLKPIQWNRAAVIADLSRPPNSWDAATIETNIFHKYEPRDVLGTEVDPGSIMMYPIPAAWTLDGFSTDLNPGLSQKDRELVRLAYPW